MNSPATQTESRPKRKLSALSGALLALLTLAYPFLVYWGLTQFDVRLLALVLLLLFFLRLVLMDRSSQSPLRFAGSLAAGAVVLCGLAFAANDPQFFLFYPVVVNGVMLAGFAWTLRHPPPMIERFARLREPDLPQEAVAYCRKVTLVWCGFFVFNGTISFITVLLEDRQWWMLYNGLVSYLLIGLLGGTEFLIRRRLRKRYAQQTEEAACRQS